MTEKAAVAYQMPGRDNRQREHWNMPNEYEMPPVPRTEPTADDDVMVPTEVPLPSAELDTVVDVRVVAFAREPDRYRDVGLTQFSVGPGSRVSVPIRRERQSLRLVNTHATDPVYVGIKPTDNDKTGYPLLAGKDIVLNTQRQISIFNPAAANTVIVGVAEEYVTELK